MEYRCDHCGACCEKLIVEVDDLDVLREPRLSLADPRTQEMDVDEVMQELRDEAKCLADHPESQLDTRTTESNVKSARLRERRRERRRRKALARYKRRGR